ncbi:MAG TPA: TonB family protein [Candidatus Angelobacter sp.]|nr:TonB family protein [Candidatus Angelobacter sp.]
MEPPIREAPKAAVPAPILDGELHLLIGDLREDVARYRRREAVWISLAAHGLLLLALMFVPKWLPKPIVVVPLPQKEQATDIVISPSAPPKTKPPEISSNRIHQQKQAPVPSREDLRRLVEASRAPGRETPPPKPAPQQAMQPPQQQPPQPQTQEPAAAQQRTSETAKLEMPAPKQNPFSMSSPGSSIDQAIHSAANNRTGADVGATGGHTAGVRPKVDRIGDFQVLTDTLGVDFGPYWKRVQISVQDHWDPLVPEVARAPMMKKGVVVIEFAIMKNGTIQGMKLISTSGDLALDRAAWGALTSADPLPQLPVKFTGDFVLIRAAFYYNPDKSEFQ